VSYTLFAICAVPSLCCYGAPFGPPDTKFQQKNKVLVPANAFCALETQNSTCSTALIFFTHALNNKLDRVKFGLDECDVKIEGQIEAKQTGHEVSHRSVR